MGKIRVLIADDHAVLRSGLRMIINTQPDIEVVGEAASGHEAVRMAGETHPDVLTLDLTMPGGSSIPMIERLRQECPQTRVLVLTMHNDTTCLHAVLAAGGLGYVVKTAADAELLTAIRAVSQGHIFVDLHLADGLVPAMVADQAAARAHAADSPGTRLSPREREVLEWLAQGHTNQEVADRLFLSVKTVETYRARIAQKLGFHRRADFVRYGAEIGLLGPGKLPPQNKLV